MGARESLSIPESTMTSKTLRTLRTLAFQAQSGRCYYCGFEMWEASPDELGLRRRSAAPFRCTAEHLVAKQDGGKDSRHNVVAAHATCNHRRHKRAAPAPSADEFKVLVLRRVAQGKWWPSARMPWHDI
jgi:5-methylcytosine-specific restriction endonuclease McrA